MKNLIKKLRAATLPFILMLIMVSTAMPVFAATWVEEEKGWKYYNDEGETETGWVEYEDNWYYLNKNGYRKTGWVKDKGDWYYLDENGVKLTDTWIDNYYVDEEGCHTKTR